jgi:UDP-N-acetylmuramoyl-L-alanyl-D-glutamate--2,6-diaminopimelate ligase
MNLGEILSGVRLKWPLSLELAGMEISGLEYDSRRVTTGSLFFAFPGSRTDGRQFARDAVARGASAVASESPMPEGFAGAWIEVEHGRQALSLAARNFYSIRCCARPGIPPRWSGRLSITWREKFFRR